MKEYDVNDDLNNQEPGNDNKEKTNIISMEDMNNLQKWKRRNRYDIKAIYGGQSSITDRLNFLINARKWLEASSIYDVPVLKEEADAIHELEKDFMVRYIADGSPDTVDIIIDMIKKSKAETEREFEREYNLNKKELKAKDGATEDIQAYWLTGQTGSYMDDKAVYEIAVMIKDTLYHSGDKKLSDKKRNDLDEATVKKTFPVSGIENWVAGKGKTSVSRKRINDAKKRVVYFQDIYIDGMKKNPGSARYREKFWNHYNSIESLEDKLRFIVDYGAYYNAFSLTYDNSVAADNLMQKFLDSFTKEYIAGSSLETMNKVLNELGRITANSTIDLMDVNNRYLMEFADEGKIGIQKADELTWKTRAGFLAQSIRTIDIHLRNAYDSNKDKYKDEIIAGLNINENTTLQEYAVMTGKDVSHYRDRFKENPDAKIVDCIRKERINEIIKDTSIENNEGINVQELFDLREEQIEEVKNTASDVICQELIDSYYNSYANGIFSEGAYEIINARLDNERKEHYAVMTQKINEALNSSKIKDWLAGEGAVRLKEIEKTSATHIINDFTKKVDNSVGYDQYIRLHTGYDVSEADNDRKKDYLSKALAAKMLQNSDVKFSLKKIHVVADEIKKRPAFSALCNNHNAVDNALTAIDGISKVLNELFGQAFVVDNNKIAKYIRDMNELSKNMMSSENRSAEYKAFCKAVKNISDLKGVYDYNNDSDMAALSDKLKELNMNLMNTARTYITGKEKIRSSSGGIERFNNAIDALAILSRNAPGIDDSIKTITDNINAKRKADAGSSKYIDIAKYGNKRAKAAKAARDISNNKVAVMKH